ncbi:MAG: hypothetical protein LBI43_06755 [Streptococcaceae bacterium]|jgi:hypothetical protein|nr:hypothetical protein [Streptococcaceae bacterium]
MALFGSKPKRKYNFLFSDIDNFNAREVDDEQDLTNLVEAENYRLTSTGGHGEVTITKLKGEDEVLYQAHYSLPVPKGTDFDSLLEKFYTEKPIPSAVVPQSAANSTYGTANDDLIKQTYNQMMSNSGQVVPENVYHTPSAAIDYENEAGTNSGQTDVMKEFISMSESISESHSISFRDSEIMSMAVKAQISQSESEDDKESENSLFIPSLVFETSKGDSEGSENVSNSLTRFRSVSLEIASESKVQSLSETLSEYSDLMKEEPVAQSDSRTTMEVFLSASLKISESESESDSLSDFLITSLSESRRASYLASVSESDSLSLSESLFLLSDSESSKESSGMGSYDWAYGSESLSEQALDTLTKNSHFLNELRQDVANKVAVIEQARDIFLVFEESKHKEAISSINAEFDSRIVQAQQEATERYSKKENLISQASHEELDEGD